MILYEFEGKDLLKAAGINVPNSKLLISLEDKLELEFPVMLKAQVLSGKRAKAGGIIKVDNENELVNNLEQLLGKVVNKETVEKVLAEERIEIAEEHYFSITYDGETRGMVLNLSQSGGSGIEERGAESFPLNILNWQSDLGSINSSIPKDLLQICVQLFLDSDALLLEINPLVKTSSGEWIALDAKIKLDETAIGRHEEWKYPPRLAPGYSPTEREIEAKKIDEGDYRGTAGSAFFDLEGDIAIMASGGGGSLTAMDTLIRLGGKPANYTEYSGNPPKEKVEKLTEIVLSKPGLHGLWVVGALANLTDIFETLSGLIEGLRKLRSEKGIKIDFPIVIRRAGPRDDEAFKMLREVEDFDLTLFGTETSIEKAAKVMAEKARAYEATATK